jgi:hypothetical protein
VRPTQRAAIVPFKKGESGNPGGLPGRASTIAKQMVIFDLKQAARALCPRAIKVLAEALHHKDLRVRLIAAGIAFERGYGKPERRSDNAVNHKLRSFRRSWKSPSGSSTGGSRKRHCRRLPSAR